MVRFCAARIVIIGSCVWWLLKAQDTSGVYFSARGFTFDSYYRKAILTTDQELLSGKAAFLLTLGDTLAREATNDTHTCLNLHRFPGLAGYLESPTRLPDHWRGLLYIQRLELRAEPQKAVFARSNRLFTERFHSLSAHMEGIYFGRAQAVPLDLRIELPSEGWREALIQTLLKLMSEHARD